ncbi:MAG: DUF4190 domain-containing protein [Clostridia bacterium]|nr:DUF4190 domain-containing protein [Clostridia bacterium]
MSQNYEPNHINQPTQNNNSAIISMVLGIISIVVANPLHIPSVLAIVFALKDKKEHNGAMTGMATAGLICGIVGTALGIISSMIATIAILFYVLYVVVFAFAMIPTIAIGFGKALTVMAIPFLF